MNIPDLIAAIKSRGGEAVENDHEPFANDLGALLAVNPIEVPDRKAWREALAHGFSYYYWRWDKRGVQHFAAVERAILWCKDDPAQDIDLLCDLVEFHYFLVWCFNGSSTEQSRLGIRALRSASEAFARDARTPPTPPDCAKPRHVIWLAMFATADDPMSASLRHAAPALLEHKDRFRLSVIAWRSPQPAFIDWLRSQGVTCHMPDAATPTGMIAAIEAIVSEDPGAIVISDMNNAIPTALFARRLAPAQVFLQGGMPVWPVRPLDGVFNSFGFDPETAGWGNARMMSFNPPWDLAKLNPSEKQDEIASERARLPQGKRLIGNYGRLVKVTRPCLEAAEKILMRCPDVAFVTGGTGDATEISAFMASSPVGDRMKVIEGFVPGHTWGRFLEVFLDTWPVTGGESCREMIAKGRPVVTMHSKEMPAINEQRDKSLVAQSWDEYARMGIRLLTDARDYTAACARARSFANHMVDGARFSNRLADDLDGLLEAVQARSRSRLSNFWRRYFPTFW